MQRAIAHAQELRHQVSAYVDPLFLLLTRLFRQRFGKMQECHKVFFVDKAHEFHKTLKRFPKGIPVAVQHDGLTGLASRKFRKHRRLVWGNARVDQCVHKNPCGHRLDVVDLAS